MTTITDLRELDNNSELEHHGVKGMKWGVRKDRDKNSEAIEARKLAKANRRSISNTDLDAYISRLKKEQELKKLVEEDSPMGRGKHFVNGIMSESGKRILTGAASGAGAYILAMAVSNKFNPANTAKGINPIELGKQMMPKKK